jgi:hypothetical protein
MRLSDVLPVEDLRCSVLAELVLPCFAREQIGVALSVSRDQADGALSSAAVPRGGLWPPTPPLCRCAKCTADQILRRGRRSTAVLPNHPSTQPWHLVCTAQRHKGGGRRPGDSRGAVHTKCQGEHRAERVRNWIPLNCLSNAKEGRRQTLRKNHPIQTIATATIADT